VPTTRSRELRALAQRIADALPPEAEEVVLTGSVSRGVADELSDVELLLVTESVPARTRCVEILEEAGLDEVTTWEPPTRDSWWSGGTVNGVRVEAIWWPREKVEGRVAAILAVEVVDHVRLRTAEALVNGVALRTAGGFASWQAQLASYPEALARAVVEDAAAPWAGDPPATMLTILRPGDRLALTQRLYEDAENVLRIVYAVNRAWEPDWKRLGARLAALEVQPERTAERIDEALLEPDGRRALRLTTELARDAVAVAPDTPSVVRAREWLPQLVEVLR
jgi:predicted nucleotidyltransferase